MQREPASPCCCGCPLARETEFYQNADSKALPRLYFYACGKSRQHPLKGGPLKTTNADAFLIDRQVLGIADGVSSVEAEGFDPSRLPVELLTECSIECRARQQCSSVYDAESENLWTEWDVKEFSPQEYPLHILSRAHASCSSWGATTCVLTILDQSYLWTVNIGDSQALVLRRTSIPPRTVPVDQYRDHELCYSSRSRIGDLSLCGGYQVIHRVTPQQHFFNCPFQLTRMPDLDCSFGEVLRRTADSADVSGHEVEAGDIIIMGSDGLFDNLFDEDILHVVNKLCWGASKPGEPPSTDPHVVAEKLLEMAMIAANGCSDSEKAYLTPYAEGAFLELGKRLYGGKPDDITAVVGYIIDREARSRGKVGDSNRTGAVKMIERDQVGAQDTFPHGSMDPIGELAAEEVASHMPNGPSLKFYANPVHQQGIGVGDADSKTEGFINKANSSRSALLSCQRSQGQSLLPAPTKRVDHPPLNETHTSLKPKLDMQYASLAAAVASSRRSFPPGVGRGALPAAPAWVASVHSVPAAFGSKV
ncbi:putative T-cell activation protein phosphatase 2C [Neospora caninum Liverpool]|uniref:Protein phosphatase n=1 Tax=Neospora caninum (strain Liverpool) TaxID=572307 RepID=F0V7S7_NEOCL|nr:putative T-cell activation protein phosphatase 2C [Neospora caninum Liverpool]CBZ49768.1 putative T-cell activation protein phosphatase 2C [Neospora caninum Liverpool]CEL64356.1 TPA: T-cell activation protein phosphatase 2C,putative [Neospora caninum Liverpool]|eukprot:XP_003879803.1 putative T-cell activation protein phosphatase 2C [Neospora caninum Liverpool]